MTETHQSREGWPEEPPFTLRIPITREQKAAYMQAKGKDEKLTAWMIHRANAGATK